MNEQRHFKHLYLNMLLSYLKFSIVYCVSRLIFFPHLLLCLNAKLFPLRLQSLPLFTTNFPGWITSATFTNRDYLIICPAEVLGTGPRRYLVKFVKLNQIFSSWHPLSYSPLSCTPLFSTLFFFLSQKWVHIQTQMSLLMPDKNYQLLGR